MSANVTRRSARAILLDGPDLLLIRRTRPNQPPYWVTIGGGVEPEDSTLEDAVRREVLEEIGARITKVAQVLVLQDDVERGITIQHMFLAELEPVEFLEPTGEELLDPSRGGYELTRVPFNATGLSSIDLKPARLAEYLIANYDALLASLGCAVMNPTSPVERR